MLPADWQRRYKGSIVEQRPLAPLTSWRIGGPAQLFVEPATVEELVDTVRVLRRVGLPYRVLGGGSNLPWRRRVLSAGGAWCRSAHLGDGKQVVGKQEPQAWSLVRNTVDQRRSCRHRVFQPDLR